jgi:hypothetical protein
MYYDLVREPSNLDARQGSHYEFLNRYRGHVAAKANGENGWLDEFLPKIAQRIADTRNLRCAWDHVTRYGGDAPGPDGIRSGDIPEREVWGILRAVGRSILDGSYVTGPSREIQIPKAVGFRTISVMNYVE